MGALLGYDLWAEIKNDKIRVSIFPDVRRATQAHSKMGFDI